MDDRNAAEQQLKDLTEDQRLRRHLLRNAKKHRRTSLPPKDALQGAEEAMSVWEIASTIQLEHWVASEPEEVLSMLNDLRRERDASLQAAEELEAVDARREAAVQSARTNQARVSTLDEEYMALRDQLEEARSNIQQLQEVLELERHAQQATETPPLPPRDATPNSTASMGGQRSIRHPDPPILTDGKDPEFEGWTQDIQDKLDMNGDHFATELEKAKYVIGRTGAKAKAAITSHRVGNPEYFQTPVMVIGLLTSLFGDPDKENRYRRDWNRLYQRADMSFANFFMEVRKLASYLNYSDKSVMDCLKDKSNSRLREALATYPTEFRTVEELRVYMQRVDNSVAALHADRDRQTQAREARTNRQASQATTTAAAAAAATVAATNRLNTPFTPYRSSSPGHRPSPRPLTEITCFKCGKKGHFMATCTHPASTVHEMSTAEQVSPPQSDNRSGNVSPST